MEGVRSVREILQDLKPSDGDVWHLFVPAYQRGYRWTPTEAMQLVDDVRQWQGGAPYFLQLLAVRKDATEKRIRIIDGQQRLTTILLLLKAFGLPNEMKIDWGNGLDGCLQFETRTAKDGIDSWYRGKVAEAIEALKKQMPDEERTCFVQKLLDAQFLYFDEIKAESEQDFFSRLNTWKIPATDSELVKCLLLTKDDEENSLEVDRRSIQWNQIERWLSNDDVWSFVEGGVADRMGQLLAYTGIKEEMKVQESDVRFPLYEAFSKSLKMTSVYKANLWARVMGVFELLRAWYSDSFDRHLVGWYLHRKGGKLPNRIDKLLLCEAKLLLREAVDAANVLIANKDSWLDDQDLYHNHKDEEKLHQYLLLSNVAWCCVRGGADYDFRRHLMVGSWSIEHVHARNQRKLDEIEFKGLQFKDKGIDELWKEYAAKENDEVAQSWLVQHLSPESGYPEENEDNSLGNLALLPKDANSSLNNKLFAGKRKEILSWTLNESAYWAPPLTCAMFMKEVGDPTEKFKPYWSKKDREAVKTQMKTCIDEFLSHFDKMA